MPLAQATDSLLRVEWTAEYRDSSLRIFGDLSGDDSQRRAATGRVSVVFDGVLYDRADLQRTLRAPSNVDDAGLVLLAYERWGADLLRNIKGIFALIVWDGAEGRLLAARDPIGHYPLFYSMLPGGGLLFSTSIEALLGHPQVGRALNRAVLADHLCQRWPDVGETFFESVKRVPPGHRLLFDRVQAQIERYWDPLPPGRPVNWVTAEELETFDSRFETAVERTLTQGRAGVFLGGGLDSTSVAAVAADVANRVNQPLPIALSVGFPDPIDESPIQRGVASSLGLSLDLVPIWNLVQKGSLLARGLEIARTLPAPVRSPWAPAYDRLVERGRQQGVRVFLSGAGGDELLGAKALFAADLLRSGNVLGLMRHVATWNRSYRFTPLRLLKSTLWSHGARPLAVSILEHVVPNALNSHRIRRSMAFAPRYVAPDPRLRDELERRVGRSVESVKPGASMYIREVRNLLDRPLMTSELEESFVKGRRLGVRFLHPLWDADLAHMLYRTPQSLLYGDGRAKYLVRKTLAQRFPQLGLDRQKKLAATPFFRSILASELPGIWSAMRAVPNLARLGVVDVGLARQMVEEAFRNADRRSLGKVWELLKLEAWVGSRL